MNFVISPIYYRTLILSLESLELPELLELCVELLLVVVLFCVLGCDVDGCCVEGCCVLGCCVV